MGLTIRTFNFFNSHASFEKEYVLVFLVSTGEIICDLCTQYVSLYRLS